MTRIARSLGCLATAFCLILPPGAQAQQPEAPAPLTAAEAATAQALALWQAGLAAVQANEPRAALGYLEPLVSLAPRTTRFRLELARAYFLVGEDDKARFHFERALGEELSPEEVAAVQQFLDAIEARREISFGFGISLIAESNPGQRTSAETIEIGGLPFVLNETAESGTGYEARASVTWEPRLDRDRSARVQLSFRDRAFEIDSFDDRTLGAEAGLHWRADRGATWGAGVLAGRRWVGEDAFSRDLGLFATASILPDPATRLTWRGALTDRQYDEAVTRDATITSLGFQASHVVAANLALRGGLDFSRTEAVTPWESGTTIGFSAGASYAFEGGLTLIIDAGLSRDDRDGIAPLFTEPREDVASFVALSALYRDLTVFGATPVLGLRYDDRTSPIAIYDYNNLSVTFGFTRTF